LRPPAKPRDIRLDTLLDQEEGPKGEGQASAPRASIVALATTIGLLVFLIASSPGGLSGTSGFLIGFGAVLALGLIAALLAVASESRERRLAREEMLSILTAALLVDRQRMPTEQVGGERAVISDACVREILDFLRSASRERPR
jgi:hypothetical protein